MNRREKTDYDVVIVGGGAIGGTLALELDAIGYRVAVIELQTPSFASTDPERVIALNYGSRCHLERLGIWPDAAAPGVGLIEHIVVTEPGNSGRVDMDAADGVADAPEMRELGYVIEMGQLLKPIYAMMQERSITLLSPARVHNIEWGDASVAISLDMQGESETISALLLVGADGTNSQVRQLAGIQCFGWDYNRFGIVASVRCEQRHGNVAYECFRQSGPLALLPLADGRFSIVWAATPAEATQLLAMDDAQFIDVLRRAVGDAVIKQTGAICASSSRASFPLELTVARTFSRSRLALAGNAAHTVHPVAGQGMNLGLRDVVVLRDMLDSDLARNDPGQSILMQGYAEQRRADVLAVAGFTESMVHLFGATIPGVKGLRGMGLKSMAQLRGLSDLLLKQASGIGQMGDGMTGSGKGREVSSEL